MKKITSFILVLCLLLTVGVAGASANPKQVVIVPYVNSTEEGKEYIGQTVNEKFKEQFSNTNYQMVSDDKVQPVLSENKFDASNKELPESDLLIRLAKATDADYVIAMEIVHFMNSRHMAYFSTSAKSEVKLRYKVYSKSTDKVITFQTTGKGNNKVTSIGVPGIGTAMKRGITQAMDEAYLKIEKM